MKKLFLLISILLLCPVVFAQSNAAYLEKEFSGLAIKRLEVNTAGGYIKVNGGRPTTKVRVFVQPNRLKTIWSKTEIAEKLDNYLLEIKVEKGILICTAQPKNTKKHDLLISFEIDSPEHINARLVTSGGSITLNQLNGNIDFATSGGSLDLTHLSGNIKGATSGGSIKADGLRDIVSLSTSGGSISAINGKGKMSFATSGGSLSFENLNGDISGKTSGGSIKLINIDGDTRISTSGGSIRFTDVAGNLVGKTSGGSIEGNMLTISNTLDLRTSAGTIRVDLPFAEGMDLDLKGSKIHSKKLEAFTTTLKDGKVNGKVNGGGKKVTLQTSVGSIYVD